MPRPTIADHAAEMLASGPLALDLLTEQLVAAGVTKAKNPRAITTAALRSHTHFVELPGHRWAHVPALLGRSVFTHEITADEIASDELTIRPDLAPLALRLREPIVSNLGELVADLDYESTFLEHRLCGPAGWLNAFGPGDLLAVRREGDRLELTQVTSTTAAPFVDKRLADEADRQLSLLERKPGRQPPVLRVSQLVHHLLAEQPDAFAVAGPPLTARFRAEAWDLNGDLLGRVSTDWSSWEFGGPRDWDEEPHVLDWKAFGLDDRGAAAMEILLATAEDMDGGEASTPGPETLKLSAALLGYPEVAGVLSRVAHDLDEVAGLRLLSRLAAEVAVGTDRAACLLVLSACEEAFAQDLAAEQALMQALAADPDHPEALFAAARYAEDRGDAARAVQLLRRAQVAPDDKQLTRLRPFTEPPDTGVSRNAPCPCGSGRKHKACCLPQARYPLAARARWLRFKLVQWALEPAQRDEWVAYAEAIAPDAPGEWVPRLLGDALLQDLGIWGAQLVAEFADSRRELLPADELALLEEWVDVRPALYEVVSAHRGRGLTLRDVEADTLLDVADKAASTSVPPGQLLFMRALPDGAGGHFTGGVASIPRSLRARLLDVLRADAHDLVLATWLGAASRPPELRTPDGGEMVLCSGKWEVRDPRATAKALAKEIGEPLQDGQGVVTEGESIVVHVSLTGNELELTTMSRERWVRAEQLVAKVAPGAVVLSSDELPAAALMSGEVTPLRRPTAPEAMSPEVREAMLERMAEYERSWVEEPVPALGGLTPRAALLDPSRRKDLIELLADFDVHAAAAPDPDLAMSPDRIRALLGLR